MNTREPLSNALKTYRNEGSFGIFYRGISRAYECIASLDAAVEHLDNFWPMGDGAATLEDKLNGRDLTFENGSWDGDVAMFDGSSTYAWDSNEDNYFTELDNFTIFGWAYTTDSGSDQVFAGSYVTETDGGSSWDAWISPEDPSGDRKNNHSMDGDDFEATELEAGPAPENEWFSFAFARTASDNEWRYYEDGDLLDAQDDYSSLTGSLNANDEEFWVGAIQFNDDRHWDGSLMDLGFNATTALDTEAIQDLHNETGPNRSGGSNDETTVETTQHSIESDTVLNSSEF